MNRLAPLLIGLVISLACLPAAAQVTPAVVEAMDTTGLNSHSITNSPSTIIRDCFGPGKATMPSFIGGDTALVNFLKKHVHWPSNLPTTVRGKVYVRFTVDTKGSIQNVAVVRSLHPLADAEAIRVAQTLSGHFKPGTNRYNQPVDIPYTLPLFFNP